MVIVRPANSLGIGRGVHRLTQDNARISKLEIASGGQCTQHRRSSVKPRSGRGRPGTQPVSVSVSDTAGPPGARWIRVAGFVDGTNKAIVADSVARAIADKPSEVVVDLSRMGHTGDSGLSVFVGLVRSVKRYGGRVVFRDVGPEVMKTWTQLGIDRLLSIESIGSSGTRVQEPE